MIPSAPLGTDAAAGRPLGLGAAPAAGPDRATAERRFRFELAAHPGSPARARQLTRARLAHWSVGEDACDTAALVVSELVTNAIVHTASSVVVCELHDGDELVRIAVRDEGCAPGEPHPSPQQPEEEHGRGLLLIDALCHSWGAHEHGPGLLVWAELPRQAGPSREDTGPCADLGWGARPKPGPSDDGSSGEDESEAHQGSQAHRGPEAHHPAQAHRDAHAHHVTGAHHGAEACHHAHDHHGTEPQHLIGTQRDPGTRPGAKTRQGSEGRHGPDARHIPAPSADEPAHHRAAPETEARRHGTGAMSLPPLERDRKRGRT